MRHYEMVILVHPDQSSQVPEMVKKYQEKIGKSGGIVHRFEDWGRLLLAYSIDKVQKAHYLLMNVEVEQELMNELENNLRFNDAVLRYVILKCEKAFTRPSPMKKQRKTKFSESTEQSENSMGSKSTTSESFESEEESELVEDFDVEKEEKRA